MFEYDYLLENDYLSSSDEDDYLESNDVRFHVENVKEEDCIKLITINGGHSSSSIKNLDKDNITYKEMGKIIDELLKNVTVN